MEVAAEAPSFLLDRGRIASAVLILGSVPAVVLKMRRDRSSPALAD